MISPDFVPPIHRFDVIASTNATAKDLARNGAPVGTVVLAKAQTAGRGRGTHVWHSPEGGLYLSIVLSVPDPRRITDLSIVAGAALAQAVKDTLPKSKDVSVKWPNDCLVGWKKIGGVLCETLGDEYQGLCVIGIGVNVNIGESELAPFASNPFSATSYTVETGGGPFELEKVLNVLLAKLFTLYRLYLEDGFPAVKYVWERNCHFIGKRVELKESGWKESDRTKSGLGVKVGTFRGIDDSGALVISNHRGESHQYFTGEITCFWP